MSERLAYRPEELAEATGLSLSHVYRMIGEGNLPVVKLGTHATLIMASDIQEYFEERRIDNRPEKKKPDESESSGRRANPAASRRKNSIQ